MRRNVIFVCLFVVIILAGLAALQFLTIRTIKIQGADSLDGIYPLYNKPIFFIREIDLANSLKNLNPDIENVQVVKKWPNTITISVRKLAPIAKLHLEDGYLSIAINGRTLLKQRDDISTISTEIDYYQPLYFQAFEVGETIEQKEIADAVMFVNEINKLAIPVSKVDIRNENMIVLISEAGEIRTSSTKDVREQIAQLKVVLEQLKLKSLEFERIDVRFDEPVVAFK